MSRRLPILDAAANIHAERLRIASDYESSLKEALVEMGSTISCRKGCFSCCHYPLLISVLEGLRLFQHLDSVGKWTSALKRKCQEHSHKVIALAPEVWLLSMTPCPLLTSTGACGGYSERPLHCRTLISASDPKSCHPHELANGDGPFPRTDPLREMDEAEKAAFKKLGSKRLLVPISTALLLAEEISGSDLDILEVHQNVLKTYVGATDP